MASDDLALPMGGDNTFAAELGGPQVKGLIPRLVGDAYDKEAGRVQTQLPAAFGTGEDMLGAVGGNLEVQIPAPQMEQPSGDERRGETPMPGAASKKMSDPFAGKGRF